MWISKRLPQLKESSQYSFPRLIAKHLRPWFDSMSLENIKTGNVNDWITDLQKEELEPKTVHNIWKMFRDIMNWHCQQNDEQPRKWYPNLPVIPADEQRWFTQDEIKRLVESAKGQYTVLFHLAGFSGLRAGELFGLHVEDLDSTRGVIHVRRSVWRGQEVTPKTRNGYRDVFIDSVTVRLLKEHLGERTSGRVFQSHNGTPLDTHNVVRQVLKPLCKRLGMAPAGMHAFRHGRVSHLQQQGAPAEFTKKQVGLSSLRTTNGYTHFSEVYIRETVEKLANGVGLGTHSSRDGLTRVGLN